MHAAQAAKFQYVTELLQVGIRPQSESCRLGLSRQPALSLGLGCTACHVHSVMCSSWVLSYSPSLPRVRQNDPWWTRHSAKSTVAPRSMRYLAMSTAYWVFAHLAYTITPTVPNIQRHQARSGSWQTGVRETHTTGATAFCVLCIANYNQTS